MRAAAPGAVVLAFLLGAPGADGAEPTRGPQIRISRAAGPITIDGDLSDPGWQGATPIDTWYETNPGDNIPAKLRNVAYLAYDDRFLYAAFRFEDPDPSKIRAPYGDHDALNGSSDDYGGIILDTNGEAKTAILFLASPRGVRYDAVSDDATGNEDSSPDFYWDSAAKITKDGWQLEIRIPFSSLRYPKAEVQKWNVHLYRNYPRDFRYQMFAAKLPRDENCFICHASPLAGLVGLPEAGHLVAAPYVSAKEEGVPREGPGSDLVNKPVKVTGGLDLKWTPNAVTALDAAINPDFSQIESDVAQIAANERFALLYPEKRPFFLEGVDLLATQIPAVYTRSITSPRWGARATGKLGETSYTAFVAEDRGGGSVILPGPNGSDLAPQDFSSFVGIGRVKQHLGLSFAGLLVTDREIQGGGYNRVFGPDFQWRPNAQDTLTGQVLFSFSQLPNRPDLTPTWDGRTISGHGADAWYSHSTATWDFTAEYKDFADGFRADDGFVPQVGYRETYGETGWTVRPATGAVRRLRTFLIADYQAEPDGALVFRQVSPGIRMDGILSSYTRIRVAFDRVRAQEITLPRTQLLYTIQLSPSRTVSYVSLDGFIGEEIDFTGARPGHGGRVTGTVQVRPGNHLALQFDGSLKWLNVRPFEGGDERRLFSAQVERLKAMYMFNDRSYLRLIGQWEQLNQTPELYQQPVVARSGAFSGSLLFAYKLNWQTVFFAGYGDNRTFTDDSGLQRADRQIFVKASYAFQR